MGRGDITIVDAVALSRHMPELFKELASHVSLSSLLRLAEQFGGTRIKIPKTPTTRGPLASLDPACLAALCAVRGGENTEIPFANALRRALRDREIAVSLAPIREISRRHKLSERHVWRIKRAHRASSVLSPARAGTTEPPPSRGSVPSKRSGSSFPTATPRSHAASAMKPKRTKGGPA